MDFFFFRYFFHFRCFFFRRDVFSFHDDIFAAAAFVTLILLISLLRYRFFLHARKSVPCESDDFFLMPRCYRCLSAAGNSILPFQVAVMFYVDDTPLLIIYDAADHTPIDVLLSPS